MSRRYALYGTMTRDFVTWRGRFLVHDNQSEMAFLVPKGTLVPRELPRDIPEELTMPLLAHPNFEGVTRPIRKDQFRGF